MGIRAVFDAVRTLMIVARPNLTMELTSETLQWHTEPERLIWILPGYAGADGGGEQYTREKVTRGSDTGDPAGTDGVIWNRRATCLVHFWIPGVTDARNVEYPNDNEDPSLGMVWLPAVFLDALQTIGGGAVYPGAAGFLPRTTGNEGFAYVIEIAFDLPVYRLKTNYSATIQSVVLTGEVV